MNNLWLLAALLGLPTLPMQAQGTAPAGLTTQNPARANTIQTDSQAVLLLDDVIREALEKSPEIEGAYHAASVVTAYKGNQRRYLSVTISGCIAEV